MEHGSVHRPRRALGFTPMETDRETIVRAAVRAESLGYEAVLVPEGWALDATVVLTEIAVRTERIRLISGIQSIWGRSPAALAMAAATLDDVSHGRFTLGLGASTATLAERLHGVRFDRPADRLAEAVGEVRTLLDGGRANDVHGQPGLRLGLPARPGVPLLVAGLGPRTVRVAVTRGDAWYPAFTPFSQLAAMRAEMASVAAPDCELFGGPAVVVDEDPDEAWRRVTDLTGWYVTGMGAVYGDHLARLGFAEEVAALRAANPAPRPGRISWPHEADRLADEVAVHGSAAEVAEGLRRWAPFFDLLVVVTGPGDGHALDRMIDAAAPSDLN
ncbi:MAG: LLM class flavin-dependent oxidoreductase [Actinomycetota bacterium]